MKDAFEIGMEFVFKWEGVYVNDPNDPGGETKYGISKRQYPMLDIKNITYDDAKKIYHRDFWLKTECDKLEFPLSVVVFDTAVNMGVEKALELKNFSFSWVDYLFLRIERYVEIARSRPQFLRGWINRVIGLYGMIKKQIGYHDKEGKYE